MRACKPAKNIKVDPAPTNVLARKAPKIVVIPKISQSEMVLPPRLHIPRERSNSTASNTTTVSIYAQFSIQKNLYIYVSDL